MPRARYRTQIPIRFERCYKCNSTSVLSSESVGAVQPECVFPGLGILTLPLAVFRLGQRKNLQVPICRPCRSFLWPLKVAFLVLLVAYLIAMIFNFTALEGLFGERIAAGIMVLGITLLLFAYTYFRDNYQGVQIEQIKNEHFAYEYSVASWCSEDFQNDYWRHRQENPNPNPSPTKLRFKERSRF